MLSIIEISREVFNLSWPVKSRQISTTMGGTVGGTWWNLLEVSGLLDSCSGYRTWVFYDWDSQARSTCQCERQNVCQKQAEQSHWLAHSENLIRHIDRYDYDMFMTHDLICTLYAFIVALRSASFHGEWVTGWPFFSPFHHTVNQ